MNTYVYSMQCIYSILCSIRLVQGRLQLSLCFLFRYVLDRIEAIYIHQTLMVRGYEPGREDHEFDPRPGTFFLSF